MADFPPLSKAESPNAFVDSAKKSRQEKQRKSSGNSCRVTFPNLGNSKHSDLSDAISQNPFKMPHDNDIFLIRDKERQRKYQERLRQRSLKVHEKTTYASRVKLKSSRMIKPTDSDEEEEEEEEEEVIDEAMVDQDDPQITITVTRDRHLEKECLAEYIAKKREMFLLQYSIGVKRDETRKLEEIAQAEERKLELAEQYLEEDAVMFDQFLKENDSNSAEAMRIADAEMKGKLEKIAEIRNIVAKMMEHKSERFKDEDTLKEYQLYRQFLENFTPPDVRETMDAKRKMKRDERRAERAKQKALQRTTSDLVPQEKNGSKVKKKVAKGLTDVARKAINSKRWSDKRNIEQESTISIEADSDDESDEDLELYFTDPQQLLHIFAELEEQNLSLIQNSQKSEETLEEMKLNIKSTMRKMVEQTSGLKHQLDKLKLRIISEEKRAKDLRIRVQMFSYYSGFDQDVQEKLLSQLNKRVEEVYKKCIGDNEVNISTLQMLTTIENHLEELFEQIENMPQDKVEAAEKAKEKERRLKLREEKMQQQRLLQEERIRKAMERVNAKPKKKTGRKVMFRSEPPCNTKKIEYNAHQAIREEEDLEYFFTW